MRSYYDLMHYHTPIALGRYIYLDLRCSWVTSSRLGQAARVPGPALNMNSTLVREGRFNLSELDKILSLPVSLKPYSKFPFWLVSNFRTSHRRTKLSYFYFDVIISTLHHLMSMFIATRHVVRYIQQCLSVHMPLWMVSSLSLNGFCLFMVHSTSFLYYSSGRISSRTQDLWL